jgi:hypothetical protein
MRHLARRIGLLEALVSSRSVQPCILIHQYRGETIEDALAAEGHEREVPGRLVIIFRSPYTTRDAAQGAQQ